MQQNDSVNSPPSCCACCPVQAWVLGLWRYLGGKGPSDKLSRDGEDYNIPSPGRQAHRAGLPVWLLASALHRPTRRQRSAPWEGADSMESR